MTLTVSMTISRLYQNLEIVKGVRSFTADFSAVYTPHLVPRAFPLKPWGRGCVYTLIFRHDSTS